MPGAWRKSPCAIGRGELADLRMQSLHLGLVNHRLLRRLAAFE